jgi:hypothetical protein
MKLLSRNAGKKTRGQTMVEFALVLPLLLFVMFGIMELGRLLLIFVTTTSAAREATRYATAVEDVGGVSRFQDCIGIRAAARQVDVLDAIQTINIRYYVDYGGTSTLIGTCPNEGAANQVGPDLDLGNQVVVEVISNFQPIIPNLVPININQIEAESARTVIKDVPVGVLVPPLVPDPGESPPPWVSFDAYYQFVPETAGTATITLLAVHPEGDSFDDITVNYRVSNLSEAQGGGIDYSIEASPVTIPGSSDGSSSAEIDVTIIDDLLFEYYERVIVYIESVSGDGSIVWPNVHVLYIIDDDRIPPVVNFEYTEMNVDETAGYADIRVLLDKVSGRDTIVRYRIVDYFLGTNYDDLEDARIPIEDPQDPLLPSPATPGYDYSPPPSSITIPAGSMEGIIRIPIFDDSLFEGPETIKLILGNPTNGDLGEFITHRLTIVDNEVAEPICNLSISFSGTTASITNNGSYPIYITRIYTYWTNSSRTLTSINFAVNPSENPIWSGSDTSPDADISFTSLNLNRSLLNETKNLRFNFSQNNNNTGQNRVTVIFDNGCSISHGNPYP